MGTKDRTEEFYRELRQIIQESYSKVKYVDKMLTHIMQTKLFEEMFGFTYDVYKTSFDPYRVFIEGMSIRSISQINPILIDEDEYLIDGAKRLAVSLTVYGKAPARVIPIKCTADEWSMLKCVALVVHNMFASWTDLAEVKKLLDRVKPTFERYGVKIDEVLSKLPSFIQRRIEDTIKKSELIDRMYQAAGKYLEMLVTEPEIVPYRELIYDLYNTVKLDKPYSGQLMALGYIEAALILSGLGGKQREAIINNLMKKAGITGTYHSAIRRVANEILEKVRTRYGMTDVYQPVITRLGILVGKDVAETVRQVLDYVKSKVNLTGRAPQTIVATILYVLTRLLQIPSTRIDIAEVFGIHPATINALLRSEQGKRLVEAVKEAINFIDIEKLKKALSPS